MVQLLLGPRNADKDRAAALAVRDERGYTPLLAVRGWKPGHVCWSADGRLQGSDLDIIFQILSMAEIV